MHSLLVLMKLSIYISGLSHEKVIYSRHNAKTKYELVCYTIYSSDLLYYTNGLPSFLLKFCVDEVFDDRGGLDVRRRKGGKSSSLGMPKAPQLNIQGDSSI